MVEKWLVPCNTKYFDIVNHFKNNEYAVWKNSFSINEGDILYIYLSAPYSEIKYRCVVVSVDVDESTLKDHDYAIVKKKNYGYYSKKIKYMMFKKEYEFPSGLLSLATLREYGQIQFQLQCRIDRRLRAFIEKNE